MKSLAPIVFFGYNRPNHTRLALESLSKNELAAESTLYIYVDGPKQNASEETKNAIEEVKKIVQEVNWCKEVILKISPHNKGMFHSNIDGITEIVQKYGKVILMEDDNIVSSGFLQYMNDALDFYENEPQVMHVSAFTGPQQQAEVDKLTQSTYFFYHTYTWGWGTWKRAWDKFTTDALAVKKLIKAKGNIQKLNMNGTFEFYWGLDAVAKKQFSYNTIWHSIVFLNDGLCLCPKKSLVDNIGHDGSGTNCKADELYKKNDELATYIPVMEIPLTYNKAIQNCYVKSRSLKYRFIFFIKHYARYFFR